MPTSTLSSSSTVMLLSVDADSRVVVVALWHSLCTLRRRRRHCSSLHCGHCIVVVVESFIALVVATSSMLVVAWLTCWHGCSVATAVAVSWPLPCHHGHRVVVWSRLWSSSMVLVVLVALSSSSSSCCGGSLGIGCGSVGVQVRVCT